MIPRISLSLAACIVGALGAMPVSAKDAQPTGTPVVAAGTTSPPDPGNVLNRMVSVKPPATLPSGTVTGIGYWSYVYNLQSPKLYCVEPKLFTCGKATGSETWAAPATLELVDQTGAPIKSMVLSQALPLAMVNATNIAPTLGPAAGSSSLVQWCVASTGATKSFPVWQLRVDGKSQKIEWNPSQSKVRNVVPNPNPC